MTKVKKYDLVLKTRKYRSSTLCSVYLKPRVITEKRFAPVDVNGYRMRMDKETGEVECYQKGIVELGRAASVRRSRIIMHKILDMNDFDWFVTLTFNKKRVERENPEEVYGAYKKYIDLLKKDCPRVRYITVPERHEDDCYHFHMLIGGATIKQLGLVDSGKVCCHWARKNGICSRDYFEATKDRFKLEETDGIPIYNISKPDFNLSLIRRQFQIHY